MLKEKASGWAGSLFANYSYDMPFKLRLSVYGGFGLPGKYSLQTEGAMWKTYGLTLSRSFLKDDCLTISLTAEDMFERDVEYKSEELTSSYRTTNWMRQDTYRYAISVRFTFGGLKHDVKRVAKTITNDDIHQSGEDGTSSGTSR